MKKTWVAVAVLLVLIVAGIAAAVAMGSIHGKMSEALFRAATLAEEDWGQAKALAESARAEWEKYAHLIAALADHEPLEEIDSLFLQVRICILQEDRESFAMACARLAGIAERLAQSNCPSWWNLL